VTKKSKSRTPRVPVEELDGLGLTQTSIWLQDLHDSSFRNTITTYYTFTQTFSVSSLSPKRIDKTITGILPDDEISANMDRHTDWLVMTAPHCSATARVTFRFVNMHPTDTITVDPLIMKVKATRF